MKTILLLGAGRSVSSFVTYLSQYAVSLDLHMRVGDVNIQNAKQIARLFTESSYFQFDITSNKSLHQEIRNAELVTSMLPAHLHGHVAEACLEQKKNLITASYVSSSMANMSSAVEEAGLLFLMECGLDPGIDHLSAMKEIQELKNNGAKLISFKSYTGGLVAPMSDNNPWNYKFTWNPRNVVLAGQGIVKFKRNNLYKYIPYSSLFKRLETVNLAGVGAFEAYANRDSLKYIDLYGLQDCPTVFRGTLRRLGFCEAWDFLVTLGLTDDSFTIHNSLGMTYRDFLNSFLVHDAQLSVEQKVMRLLQDDQVVFDKLAWLDLFSNNHSIDQEDASPAQILQAILEAKWTLRPEDADMVVMQHKIQFEISGEQYERTSSLTVLGENAQKTSMAKTVGLPLGIAARLILEGQIKSKGVTVPVHQEFYEPILKELENLGIRFVNEERKLS